MTRITSLDQLPLSDETRALNGDLLAIQGKSNQRKGSDLEAILAADLRKAGVTDFVQEYQFHPTRRWRFDFAWPSKMVAVEAEGGTWSGGRHVRGAGYEKDTQKYNEAAALGWTVLRFTSGPIKRGEVVAQIVEVLKR